MSIIAAADGSALGNPGPTGWAWYIDDSAWAAGGIDHGTNNIGELTAVLRLLEATADAGRAEEPLRVLCDSKYVIDSITTWMPGWKRKGWKKADGKPVKNVEIMRALDAAMQGRDVQFEWVKGHSGHRLNEAADARANGAATAIQKRTAVKEGPGLPSAVPTATAAPVGAPHPSAAPAGGPTDAAPADLFSAFTDDPDAPADACFTTVDVRGAQRMLITPRSAGQRVAAVHPAAILLGTDGSVLTADAWDEHLTDTLGTDPTITDVIEEQVGTATLLTFEVTATGGTAMRGTAVWESSGDGEPTLRLHQLAPLG
ncbi:ribonuclease HI [Helcobacillus massiliensis]|uniref:ribonuclease H family protein n=1 Tax=Helcobacillus TaxID=1161125 RepID=UPI001EF72484|nr:MULTISPECIES: ribonuclease H [Helcobacillus]MCG7426155.1 ribonuclease HI [Helcobacillus sp. ACRRO]MCT1557712.1 ribonuclease HI [Helcobacillus massiliensis]MCT2035984.1 ribonuclease HI [Helcobacillus massiliensis]MCT2331746.1 ribonuclease HI [Helcobacillus massiliensis]